MRVKPLLFYHMRHGVYCIYDFGPRASATSLGRKRCRGVKPANILVNEDCSLKICDFGLSRVVTQEPSAPPPPGLGCRSTSGKVKGGGRGGGRFHAGSCDTIRRGGRSRATSNDTMKRLCWEE